MTRGTAAPAPRTARRPWWIRDLEGPDRFEAFLVAAVSAILAIRLFLHLTGYPKVGGERLHIAHMLWGGLLMLAAIVLLLGFLGRTIERVAAIVGGLGFGTFIDEIGKFLTHDNDYFFRPAVALIYVVFVLLFLAFHVLHARRELSPTEYLLNALRGMEEVAVHDLDPFERRRALRLLRRSDPASPLVEALAASLAGVPLRPRRPRGRPARARAVLARGYRRWTRHPRFERAVVAFFVGQLAVKLVYGAALILAASFGWEALHDARGLGRLAERLVTLSGIEAVQLAMSALVGVFVLLGVIRIRTSRLRAYRWFERSILASVLLVQPFSFYLDPRGALLLLTFNLLTLAALRTMIHEERRRAA